jgi:hypothetical protein
MSPNEKLMAALFGFSSKEGAAQAAVDQANDDANQSVNDWLAAKRIADLANTEFADMGEWFPSLSFGWQARAVCITDQGARMADVSADGCAYHYAPDEYTISKTEVKEMK